MYVVVVSWESDPQAVHGPLTSKEAAHKLAMHLASEVMEDPEQHDDEDILVELTENYGAQIQGSGYVDFDVIGLTPAP